MVLTNAITGARKEEDLIPVALALRYKANPNLYIRVAKIGNLHVLAYTYTQLFDLADPSVLNGIIIMLISSGASAALPAVSSTGGGIQLLNTQKLKNMKSVSEWLTADNYPHILDEVTTTDEFNAVQPAFLIQLGTMMDRVDLVTIGQLRLLQSNETYTEDIEDKTLWPDISMEEVIRSHANKVLGQILSNKKGDQFYLSWENIENEELARWSLYGPLTPQRTKLLWLSAEYYNYPAYRLFIQLGFMPDYFLLNTILLIYKKAHLEQDAVLIVTMQNMIDRAIEMGLILDMNQFDIIAQTDDKYASTVQKLYATPYWEKVCRLPKIETGQNKLELLSAQLNLPPGQAKADRCREFKRLAGTDQQKLAQAAITRQQQRIATDMSTAEDYAEGKTASLLCRNRAIDKLRGTNPYEVNDVDLSYYRSDDGAIWCYTSDRYDDLITNSVNPITAQALPQSLVEDMQKKQDKIANMGLQPRTPTNPPSTYSQNLQKLTASDTINNIENNKIETEFYNVALLQGVQKADIELLTTEQMAELLKEIGVSQIIVGQLTKLQLSHARVTFIRAAYDHIKDQQPLINRLFENIKLLTAVEK